MRVSYLFRKSVVYNFKDKIESEIKVEGLKNLQKNKKIIKFLFFGSMWPLQIFCTERDVETLIFYFIFWLRRR